jgi:sigma-B regulation protein RsbU (phosphoserine phosphatase)
LLDRVLSSRLVSALLVGGILTIGILHVPGFLQFARSPYTGVYHQNLRITNVKDDGPNRDVDLRPGDRIVALDGTDLINVAHFQYLMRSDPGFGPRTLTVLRDGKPRWVTLRTVPQPKWVLSRRVAVSFVAYTFLVVGLLVYVRRRDSLGTLFLVNCGLITFLLTLRPVAGDRALWILGEIVYDALTLLLPVTFLHFFLVFPERSPHPRWLLRIRRRLYLIPLALLLLTLLSIDMRIRGAPSYPSVAGFTTGLSVLYLVSFMVTALVVFIRAYFISQKAIKAKIRFVIVGVLMGVVPFTAVILLKQVFPTWDFKYDYLAVIFLCSISISFGYAILKHGVLDLRIVVRRSLVYTILSAFIIALYYSTVRWFGDLLAERFEINQFVLTLVPAVLIAVAFAPLRSRVQNWVDRHFYREEIRYRETVAEFTRELSREIQATSILGLLAVRLEATLHPRSIRIYSREKSGEPFLRCLDLLKTETPPPPALMPGSALERYFTRRNLPLVVEFLDEEWKRNRLDRPSRIFLDGTGASLVAPLISHGSVIGLLTLGEKRSGHVYYETEADLLETLVEHAAVAMENAGMHEKALHQESIRQELEVARRIQANLLPREIPRYPGLDLSGKMESCKEVGGDFFDIRDFGDGRIGIAIGDVSGKGIPAALFMASLQTSFRGEALPERNPSEVLASINRRLFQMSDDSRFVTFFYGILDLPSRVFTYSNGGHPPPLLFHSPKRVTRLRRGGLPIGVSEGAVYQEGVVRIPPECTILFYTDGIAEEADGSGNRFGEEGVVQFYWTVGKKLPSATIVTDLFRRVLAFGQSRQDDMTVLAARFSRRAA